ncbi:kelch repeat-containing protein [Cytophagaceae bacterium ABcell3]|nr:kelch repeat-containing protein [Cytophagaceae bacterium ABcell3]
MAVLNPYKGWACIRRFLLVHLLMFATCTVVLGQNYWDRKADFAGASRFGAVGFAIGDKGYIGTGFDGAVDRTDFWEYDPATNTWTQKAEFSGSARSLAAAFVIENKGYVGTGASGATGNRDFFVYDQSTNTWAGSGNIGGNNLRRFYSVGFAVGNKGYVATGTNGNQRRNDLIEFDATDNSWNAKNNFAGVAREHAVGFSIGDKGYVGTGFDGEVFLKDMWEYDPEADAWTQKADLLGVERAGAIGMAIGNLGYVGTGYNSEGDLEDFYEFDPVKNEWVDKADYKGGAVKSAVAFAIGDKGYVGTGTSADQAVRGDFYEYHPGLTPVTITVGEIEGPVCSGQPVRIPYNVTGDIMEGNRFFVQVTNHMGGFQTVASIQGTTSDTAIVWLDPSDYPPGEDYLARVNTTSPQMSGFISEPFNIVPSPEVYYLKEWDEVCHDDELVILTHGTPTGGYYKGVGVIDEEKFDPDSAGVGSHEVVYTYTAENGCSASAAQPIKVELCTSTASELSETLNFKAYPNPYQGQTNINYMLERSANVVLEVRNSLGQTVKQFENGYQFPGQHNYTFSAEELGLPKGVYLVSLIIDNNSYISRIIEY